MTERKYLGEFPKNDDKTSKVELALCFISQYGYIDGAHHKQWLIDQVARILMDTPVIVTEARWSDGATETRFKTGEPSDLYLDWGDGDMNEDFVGIAP